MNRRRSNRIDVFVPTFLFQNNLFLEETFIANTSLEGMYLFSKRNIPQYTRIELQILHSHHEKLICSSIAAIVMHKDGPGYGLACDEIPLNVLAYIYHHGLKNLYKRQDYQYQLSVAV